MGTDAWRNWKAFADGEPEVENAVDELHSDRQFSGGPITFPPYSLATIIRPVSSTNASTMTGPAVRLHLGIHTRLIPGVVVDGALVPPNSSAYHGGNLSDEIAALLSLTLGVRLRVVGTAELSGIHDPNESNTPIYFAVPPLIHPGRPGREYIPAALTRSASLDELERLQPSPSWAKSAKSNSSEPRIRTLLHSGG